MWSVYLTAKTTGTRPSDLVCIEDRWVAYQFDTAVTLIGTVIENAAQEQIKTGSDDSPKWENRYTMKQLLDDDFKLPRPDGDKPQDNEDEFFAGISGFDFDEVG